MDANPTAFVTASMVITSLHMPRLEMNFHTGDDVHSVNLPLGVHPSRLCDVKLIPSAATLPRALTLFGVGESSWLSIVHANGTPEPTPLWKTWSVGDGGGFTQFESVDATHALVLRTKYPNVDSLSATNGLVLADLCADAAVHRLPTLHQSDVPFHAKSMCKLPHTLEATVAMRFGARSFLFHADLRTAATWVAKVETHHEGVLRARCGGADGFSVLASHSRSRRIQLWDLRRFRHAEGAAGDPVGRPSQHDQPADEFICAGNAPDFHCSHGIVAAISGGPARAQYGAKLHVFSAAPRRLAVEVTLPEIVIDEGYRLRVPQGIKLAGRTCTVLADKERLLRCWVP